jgi:hypothetical protein
MDSIDIADEPLYPRTYYAPGPAKPETSDLESCESFSFEFDFHYGVSRRAASPGFADIRTPVIPPGYRPIPGYEAFRLEQEARALAGSIAVRRGKCVPAPIWISGDAPKKSALRRWYVLLVAYF